MSSLYSFDKLNVVSTESEIEELTAEEQISKAFDEYFDEMDLEEDEIEDRKKLAKNMVGGFNYLLALIVAGTLIEDALNKQYYYDLFEGSYKDSVLSTEGFNLDTDEDSYLGQYIRSQSQKIVDTTILNATDDYYSSLERAIFVSENESNAVANYRQLLNAIKMGYATKKWVTHMDKKTRKTHEHANGQEKNIYEPFIVGGYMMAFPKDQSIEEVDPREIVNCRCVVHYTGRSNSTPYDKDSGVVEYYKGRKEKGFKNTFAQQKIINHGIMESIFENPSVLQHFSHRKLYDLLLEEGFDVLPLGKGRFKDIPYEDDGGYRVNYTGDKYFQFHPFTVGGHHKGEYYKISSAEKGIKRYNMKGELRND